MDKIVGGVGVGNDGVDDDAIESVAAELAEESGGGGKELGFLNERGVVVVSVLVDAPSGLTIEADLEE